MKANELRIGNLFQDREGRICSVELITGEIDKCDILAVDGAITTLPIQPIPLTEEWLLKFGAYKQDCIFCFEKSFISIEKVEYEDSYAVVLYDSYNDISVSISLVKYVHQLQNLYFALTGTELSIEKF